MLFESYETFVRLTLALLGYGFIRWLLPEKFVWHRFGLLIVNAAVLLTFIGEHTLIVLSLLSLIVYAAGKAANNKVVRAVMWLVIGLFVLRNYEAFSGLLPRLQGPLFSVERIGLSYIVFRMVHWLIESNKGKIQASDVLTFLNYIFFFPTFLAGPIDTYSNFHQGANHRPRRIEVAWIPYGLGRVLLGATKTLLLVPLVRPWGLDWHSVGAETGLSAGLAFPLSLVAYSAYILFDFSGYSDIAIGIGRWMGFRLPENFRNPYFASSLSDFWRRWHISFSNFLRRYVFMPTIRILNSSNVLMRRPVLVTILSYLFTFLLCGFWHGDALHFGVWGLWHGIGLAIAKLWRDYLRPSWAKGVSYDMATTVLTFSFVTAGWYWFHYPIIF